MTLRKKLFEKEIKCFVKYKDGTEIEISRIYVSGYCGFVYTDSNTDRNQVKTLTDKEIALFFEIKKSFFKKRKFIRVWLIESGLPKTIYLDEIDSIEKHTVLTDRENWINPEELQKDLGFYDYTQLMFDREQELKKGLVEL